MELFVTVFEGFVAFHCGGRSGSQPGTLSEVLGIIINVFPKGSIESIRIS